VIRTAAAALLTVVALVAVPAAAADPIVIDDGPHCGQITPTVLAPPSSQPVPLHVLVLLDGVSRADGEEALAKMPPVYERLGIDVRLAWDEATLSGVDPTLLMDQARARYGGRRPWNAHAVLILTARDLESAVTGSGVAGQASCVGGLKEPVESFAVVEFQDAASSDWGPLRLFGDTSAKIATHELGHLLGAHHHYSNCGEGLADHPDDSSPCTVMINDIGLASLRFGATEALAVRGYAEMYAAPLVPPAPPAAGPAPGPPQAAPAPSPAEPATPSAEPGPTGGPSTAPRPARLSLRAARVGGPRRLRFSGGVTGGRSACARQAVTLRVTATGRTLVRRQLGLDARCRYALTARLPRRRALAVRVTFRGTPELGGARARLRLAAQA
jgi:hypothetical protein